MKSKLQKLRNVSLDELRVRGSQAVNAFVERKGWSNAARLPADGSFLKLFGNQFRSTVELLEQFRGRTAPSFFFAFADPELTVDTLRRHWPAAEKEIVRRADRICYGLFDLLAFRGLNFGSPIDWHLEPIAGKRAPLVHWSKLNYLDAELFGDKKVTWELNRHQYFTTLGQAYWLTRDERYAETFANHVTEWINANPPKLGINWASSLEVSFRSISWLWALHFFKHSAVITPQFFELVLQVLYLNARHLEKYLSTYFSPNTHLTGEALGLFYLGTVLPEFKEANRWRQTGLQILLDQISKQVHDDGVYFEQASYYHRYTTDFYLHLLILLDLNNEPVPGELKEKIQLLLDHLMFVTRPDGTTPLFGDDDGGRLVMLDRSAPNDFRSTLSTGAAVFQRADYKFVASGIREETLWLVGPNVVESFANVQSAPPEKQSKGFSKGGYYVMRDGWESDSNYMMFDCGPHGMNNCGHAHADALSFELTTQGRTLLVDPGTCTYTGAKELRDWFRSSAAHNTLTIDGQSSSRSAGPFSWSSIAKSSCTSWIATDRFDYVRGTHDGFDPVRHTRDILFLKHNYWIIRDFVFWDEITGSLVDESHELKLLFHFDSSVEPLHHTANNIRVFSENGHRAVLQLSTLTEDGGEWTKETGWVSHCYGEKEAAPVFAFSRLANGSTELVTFLLPELDGACAKPSVREIEALHGKAFEVNFNGMHDVFMLRDQTNHLREWVETVRFGSDFNLAWARFNAADPRTPEELILIDGHTLEFEGRPLLRSTKRINYLVARRVGERFRVETEEGVLEIDFPLMDLETLLSSANERSSNL